MPPIADVHAAYPNLTVLWTDQRVQIIDVEKLIMMRPALAPVSDATTFASAHVSTSGSAIEFNGGHRIDFAELAQDT